MRLIFSFQPSTAHVNLYLPTVRALAERGHEVLVVTADCFVDRVERAGVSAIAGGLDWTDHDMNERWPDFAQVPRDQVAAFFIGTICASRLAPAMAASLDEIIEAFSPDLIVRDVTEFGAVIAAERRGLPTASMGFGPTPGPTRHLGLVAEPLSPMRPGAAGPPDLMGLVALHFAPESFMADPAQLDDRVHLFRPDVFDGTTPASGAIDLGSRSGERPLVYVSLGTVFSTPELFQPILDGLADLAVDVVATTGRFSPDELDVPGNAIVERYLPNSQLLPAVDLVVAHGGYTTVMGILGAGKPMVLIPFTADHPANARRCEAMGVAHVLHPDDLMPTTVRAIVANSLADPTCAANAQVVATELAAMPGPDEAAQLIEGLRI